jgi:hypothetical protein
MFPKVRFTGSVGVVATVSAEPYDVVDFGKDETSVPVAVALSGSGA